mmetsp:Transcript_88121/g.184145  ORF Transcript_88121/g.184145 Transcript_88121/m.184145 type:complete len:233 (+) Transcript_88121:1486-2184(+)
MEPVLGHPNALQRPLQLHTALELAFELEGVVYADHNIPHCLESHTTSEHKVGKDLVDLFSEPEHLAAALLVVGPVLEIFVEQMSPWSSGALRMPSEQLLSEPSEGIETGPDLRVEVVSLHAHASQLTAEGIQGLRQDWHDRLIEVDVEVQSSLLTKLPSVAKISSSMQCGCWAHSAHAQHCSTSPLRSHEVVSSSLSLQVVGHVPVGELRRTWWCQFLQGLLLDAIHEEALF